MVVGDKDSIFYRKTALLITPLVIAKHEEFKA
jgi:hypothetical protein